MRKARARCFLPEIQSKALLGTLQSRSSLAHSKANTVVSLYSIRPTVDQSGSKMPVVIVPGSGSGELRGISGTFEIQIKNGQHSYDIEYTLPQ